MIECAFEGDWHGNTTPSQDLKDKCLTFYRKYYNKTPRVRLKRILENCIENDGTFKP